MRPYETMIIFDPGAEEPVMASMIGRVTEAVRAGGGVPGQVVRWGKRALAYDVGPHSEGHYVLVEFTAEPSLPAELDRMLTLADEVIRHKVIRLPDSAAGRRPPAPPPEGFRQARAVAEERSARRRQPAPSQSGAPQVASDAVVTNGPSSVRGEGVPGGAQVAEDGTSR